MAGQEQQPAPIWAESKAKKQIDVLKEVARTLADAERVRARQPIAEMTERDLEAEQLRLGDLLGAGTLTVEGFRRLREIDFYLEAMRQRRHHGPTHEQWESERFSDE
ncbi:MAG: hypothetical protein JOZ41_03265 [Chloroflexi bacterium]|nr:hypothetical protein [Chloroflexota bacterium]